MSDPVRELNYTKFDVNTLQLWQSIQALAPSVYARIISNGIDNLRVTCLTFDTTEDANVGLLIANHNTLTVNADKTTIDADETDEAAITCSGLTSYDYKVWLGPAVVAEGSITDTTLEFSTNTKGVYLVEIISGTETGYIEITAEEP